MWVPTAWVSLVAAAWIWAGGRRRTTRMATMVLPRRTRPWAPLTKAWSPAETAWGAAAVLNAVVKNAGTPDDEVEIRTTLSSGLEISLNAHRERPGWDSSLAGLTLVPMAASTSATVIIPHAGFCAASGGRATAGGTTLVVSVAPSPALASPDEPPQPASRTAQSAAAASLGARRGRPF